MIDFHSVPPSTLGTPSGVLFFVFGEIRNCQSVEISMFLNGKISVDIIYLWVYNLSKDKEGEAMSNKWYGNLHNRLMENSNQPEEITIGMGATEIFYSDRHAYEVIEVKDQKHITVRQLKAISNGAYSNDWTLEHDEDATPIELTKRAHGWYTAWTVTREDLEALGAYKDERGFWTCDDNDNLRFLWNWGMHGIDFDKVWEKGKQSKYHKRNFIIGVADEYYDYEF